MKLQNIIFLLATIISGGYLFADNDLVALTNVELSINNGNVHMIVDGNHVDIPKKQYSSYLSLSGNTITFGSPSQKVNLRIDEYFKVASGVIVKIYGNCKVNGQFVMGNERDVTEAQLLVSGKIVGDGRARESLHLCHAKIVARSVLLKNFYEDKCSHDGYGYCGVDINRCTITGNLVCHHNTRIGMIDGDIFSERSSNACTYYGARIRNSIINGNVTIADNTSTGKDVGCAGIGAFIVGTTITGDVSCLHNKGIGFCGFGFGMEIEDSSIVGNVSCSGNQGDGSGCGNGYGLRIIKSIITGQVVCLKNISHGGYKKVMGVLIDCTTLNGGLNCSGNTGEACVSCYGVRIVESTITDNLICTENTGRGNGSGSSVGAEVVSCTMKKTMTCTDNVGTNVSAQAGDGYAFGIYIGRSSIADNLICLNNIGTGNVNGYGVYISHSVMTCDKVTCRFSEGLGGLRGYGAYICESIFNSNVTWSDNIGTGQKEVTLGYNVYKCEGYGVLMDRATINGDVMCLSNQGVINVDARGEASGMRIDESSITSDVITFAHNARSQSKSGYGLCIGYGYLPVKINTDQLIITQDSWGNVQGFEVGSDVTFKAKDGINPMPKAIIKSNGFCVNQQRNMPV